MKLFSSLFRRNRQLMPHASHLRPLCLMDFHFVFQFFYFQFDLNGSLRILEVSILSAGYESKYKIIWIPVTIDEYVKIHLQKNPDENEKVLRVRIEAALDDYKNGVKCQCGKDIWIVGSASSPFDCFSCITGIDYPHAHLVEHRNDADQILYALRFTLFSVVLCAFSDFLLLR